MRLYRLTAFLLVLVSGQTETRMKNDVELTKFTCLTADVGGTNVRFGVVSHDPANGGRPLITEQMIYPCASFESIDVAVETYRQDIDQPLPRSPAWRLQVRLKIITFG